MKIFLPFILLATGCVGAVCISEAKTQTSRGDSFTYIDETGIDPYPAVVTILYEGKLIGTGVLISPDVVLTAGHVVDGDGEYSIICGGETYCISNILFHPRFKPYAQLIPDYIEVDLALLTLETPSTVEPIKISKNHKTYKGERLEVIGHGTGRKRYSSDGSFWYFGRLIDYPWQITTLPSEDTIWYGDSGGALIDDDDDILIGIICSFYIRNRKIVENHAMDIGYSWEWIQGNLNNPSR